MKNNAFPHVLLAVFMLASCMHSPGSSTNQEYKKLQDSDKTGRELFYLLTNFERTHPEHFSSKVDLGGYYLLTGDYDKAKDYFLRAEAILENAPHTSGGQENIGIMYASLGRIALSEREYEKALSYAEKAISFNSQFLLLKAHILAAQGNDQESLRLFDTLYTNNPELFDGEAIRAYMYLLAKAKRFSECGIMIDLYFENGPFFSSLGLFSSTVFETEKQYKKSIFLVFLDYEYYSSYTQTDDDDFQNKLTILENRAASQFNSPEALEAIQLIRSLYNNAIPLSISTGPSFFVEQYILFRCKINRHTITNSDFNQLLLLEHYFSRFPIYYWSVWQAVEQLTPERKSDFVPVLEKIISLNRSGPYAGLSRDALSTMGYN
jgi:tetratricopeptide (TPR) repeat protein